VLAVVPVKDLGGAKTRLAPILSDDARAGLVLEMLDRVLAACEEATAIARTLLVTPDPSLAPDGVDVLVDAGRGHAEAIELALADTMLEAGRAAGLDPVVVNDPALALDVDRPEDFELLLASR
jgi:2-phospho-L-lactate guanylyltransferase